MDRSGSDGDIHDNTVRGKLAESFFNTYMCRCFREQNNPFWIMSYAMYIIFPIFPDGTAIVVSSASLNIIDFDLDTDTSKTKKEPWTHEHGVTMISVNDRIIYNDENLHGRIIKIVSKEDKDEFHVKVKKNDKEKILKLNADEFSRIADTYDPLKKRAFESRADMFMRKYRGDVMGCLDAKMIVQRTGAFVKL